MSEVVRAAELGILETPPLEKVLPDPEAHEGSVTAVTMREFDSGSVAMQIHLNSKNTGEQHVYDIWIPKGFAKNIHVNPNDLPKGTVDAEGREVGNQYKRYASIISNTEGNAELQGYRNLAVEQGFAGRLAGQAAPTTFEEFVQLHNTLMAGMDVVFVLRPERNLENPSFDGRLKVKSIKSPNAAQNVKTLGKGVRLMWQ